MILKSSNFDETHKTTCATFEVGSCSSHKEMMHGKGMILQWLMCVYKEEDGPHNISIYVYLNVSYEDAPAKPCGTAIGDACLRSGDRS